MNGWTFGAHAFWAASVAVTCAIAPEVPLGIAAIGALLVAWFTRHAEE